MSWMKKNNKLYSGLLIPFFAISNIAHASDHADYHGLDDIKITNGKLADYYMFSTNENLTFIVTIDSKAKNGHIDWDGNVSYRFSLDYSSEVLCIPNLDVSKTSPVEDFCNQEVSQPSKILEDVIIELNISQTSTSLSTYGLSKTASVRYAYGLFDDPFIRQGVKGKNVNAIIVEVPLTDVPVHGGNGYLLGWVTSLHNTFNIPLDYIGHPYASQDDRALNPLHPNLHAAHTSNSPDVLILDTSKPTEYPNGRALEDDVVDILGRKPGTPNPSVNDKAFLPQFPYLSPSHQ